MLTGVHAAEYTQPPIIGRNDDAFRVLTGLLEAGDCETITDWLVAVPTDAECSLLPSAVSD